MKYEDRMGKPRAKIISWNSPMATLRYIICALELKSKGGDVTNILSFSLSLSPFSFSLSFFTFLPSFTSSFPPSPLSTFLLHSTFLLFLLPVSSLLPSLSSLSSHFEHAKLVLYQWLTVLVLWVKELTMENALKVIFWPRLRELKHCPFRWLMVHRK